MFGYAGQIGYVNLTTGDIEVKTLDRDLARQFIGGSALACRLIYNQITPHTDPLSPANPLVFMSGPLTGTPVPSTSRYAVCARSPLTGIWGEATSGGAFGVKMKRASFDGLVITGKAERPVYLLVEDGEIKIVEAGNLWGKDTYETQAQLKAELGDCSVACIGPAGENRVLYAAIINDHGRAAGRCGLGAVMGSKNLKAVAVKGKNRIAVADSTSLSMMNKMITEELRKATALFTQYGTLGYVDIGMYLGDVPAKYFTENVFPVEKVTARRLREEFQVNFEPCLGCVIACGRRTVLSGKYTLAVDGPEYETAVALGPLCGCYDLDAIAYANHLCNAYGLDTISAGVTIAFAIYLLTNRLVDSSKLGFELKWGDSEKIIELIKCIAHQEGPGILLGLGVKRLAASLGVDPELAAHVKGLEIPMHDPRAFAGMALVYATGPRGACHERADFFSLDLGLVKQDCLGLKPGENRFALEGRVADVIKLQDVRELDNALVRCVFASLPLDITAGMLSLVTGEPWSLEDLYTAGERSSTLKRLLNCKLGVGRADDRLPAIVKKPYREGTNAGFVPDEARYIDDYYTLRGWDRETGCPLPETIARLGLDSLVTGS